MPVKKAYLLPHSPLLVPEIGRANHTFLAKTMVAYQEVKAQMMAANIETLIIISPHGLLQEQSFLINCAPEMNISFQDFGFIPPKTIVKGDIILADKIKTALKETGNCRLISETNLDYGSAIPLYLLKDPNWLFKTIIIAPAEKAGLEEQLDFGAKLGSFLQTSEKNIAVIASGDLSHRLKRKSPGGYSPKGPKFDNKLIEYLSEPSTATENVLKLDKRLIIDASECGLDPLTILLGMIKDMSWQPDIMAYQTDFGVGYLSLSLELETDIDMNKNS